MRTCSSRPSSRAQQVHLAGHAAAVPRSDADVRRARRRPLRGALLQVRRARQHLHRRVQRRDVAARGARRDERASDVRVSRGGLRDHLEGQPLLTKNFVKWLNFPLVRNARWYGDRLVLLGDALHTAHFSIGSGTKLALEDAIVLAQAFADAPEPGPRAAAVRGAPAPAGGPVPAGGRRQPPLVRGDGPLRPSGSAAVRRGGDDAQQARGLREAAPARSRVRGGVRGVAREAVGRLSAPRSRHEVSQACATSSSPPDDAREPRQRSGSAATQLGTLR
jgi:hypothetical protein